MRSLVVIEIAPLLDHDPGFAQGYKPLPVQAFVTQLAVEAFNRTILPRAAGLDVSRADVLIAQEAA